MNLFSTIYLDAKTFWKSLFLDVFFPKRCVGCNKYGSFVCNKCALEIQLIKTSTCPNCGKISSSCKYCPGCKYKSGSSLSALIVAAQYDSGPLKEMIHHLKYSGFVELAPLLTELIYQRVRNILPSKGVVVVPVPLHKDREVKRGFNQAELLARDLSEKLNLPGGCALSRTKNTVTQVNLSRAERLKNLELAFACTDEELIRGKTVVLVDDVATTGATLNECAKVLKAVGAKQVWGVVVAKRV